MKNTLETTPTTTAKTYLGCANCNYDPGCPYFAFASHATAHEQDRLARLFCRLAFSERYMKDFCDFLISNRHMKDTDTSSDLAFALSSALAELFIACCEDDFDTCAPELCRVATLAFYNFCFRNDILNRVENIFSLDFGTFYYLKFGAILPLTEIDDALLAAIESAKKVVGGVA